MRKLWYIALIGLFACKQFEPTETPSGNEPIFSISGSIDGQTVLLEANGDDYIAGAFNEIDTLDVNIHNGFLTDATCTECDPTIELQLRGLENINGPEAVLNQASLLIRNLVNVDSILQYTVRLNALPIANATAINWEVNGNQFNTDSVSITVDANAQTKIPFSYTVTYASGCIETEFDTIYLPNNRCDGIISAVDDTLNRVIYSVQGMYGTSYGYEWTFKDGSKALTHSVQYFYNNPSYWQELAMLTIRNEFGVAHKYFHHALDSAACAANTEYDITESYAYFAINEQPDYGQVALIYRTNGIEYSSEIVEQPNWAGLDVKYYETYTEPSEPEAEYIKASLVFNGVVANGNEVLEIRNLEMVLPFKI